MAVTTKISFPAIPKEYVSFTILYRPLASGLKARIKNSEEILRICENEGAFRVKPFDINGRKMKNSLILLPVAALMLFASYELFLEYQGENDLAYEEYRGESIGRILVTNNNVKRKFGSSLLWNSVEREEELYYRDSIRTGVDSDWNEFPSKVVIQLNDKSVIELDENSLIVLEKAANRMSVDFKTGEFSTKAGSDLQIKIKDQLIQAKDAELSVQTDTKQNTSIQLSQGQAELIGKKGQKFALDKEKQLNIDAEGKARALELKVVLSSPKNNTEYLSAYPSINYPFTWAVTDKLISRERFEWSTDPDFPPDKTKWKWAHQATDYRILKGDNYWRVGWESRDEKGKPILRYTNKRKIKVIADERIKLLNPTNQAFFQFEPGEQQIPFRWKSEVKASLYVLEIASNADFTRIIKSYKSAENQINLPSPQSGTYYWRVSAFGSKNESLGVSSANELVIDFQLFKKPDLVSPNNGFLWSLNEPILFEWQPFLKANSYIWKVSRDSAMRSLVSQKAVTETQFIWEWTDPGIYYWQVSSIGSGNLEVGKSLVYKLEIRPVLSGPMITLIEPQNQESVSRDKKIDMDPVVFRWKPKLQLSNNYQFFIADNIQFENARTKDAIEELEYSLVLKKAGNYFWKIMWQDPENPEKTQTSAVQVFRYSLSSNLLPPILERPLDKTRLVIPREEGVEFFWKPIENAINYKIRVERINESTEERFLAFESKSKQNSLKSRPLKKGKYVWSVQGIDIEGLYGTPSEDWYFEIDVNPALGAPKLRAPVVK